MMSVMSISVMGMMSVMCNCCCDIQCCNVSGFAYLSGYLVRYIMTSLGRYLLALLYWDFKWSLLGDGVAYFSWYVFASRRPGNDSGGINAMSFGNWNTFWYLYRSWYLNGNLVAYPLNLDSTSWSN